MQENHFSVMDYLVKRPLRQELFCLIYFLSCLSFYSSPKIKHNPSKENSVQVTIQHPVLMELLDYMAYIMAINSSERLPKYFKRSLGVVLAARL